MATTSTSSNSLDQSSAMMEFEEMSVKYQPGQDITAHYRLSNEYQPSSYDWVGLYTAGTTSTTDYLTFVWAPQDPLIPEAPQRRSVLFDKYYLPTEENKSYQLMYVTKHYEILGKSTLFTITSQPGADDNFECMDFELGSDPEEDIKCESCSSTESQIDASAEKVESFELIPRKDNKSKDEIASYPTPSIAEEGPQATSNPDDTTRDENNNEVTERALVVYPKNEIVTIETAKNPYNFDDVMQRVSNLNFTPTPPSKETLAKRMFENVIRTHQPSPSYPPRMATPFRSPGSKYATPTIKERPTCRDCRKKKIEIRQLKNRCSTVKRETEKLNKEMENVQEMLDLKTALLGEISHQMKDISQENFSLHTSNEIMMTRKCKVNKLARTNSKLNKQITDAQFEIKRLSESNTRLHMQNELLSQVMRMAETGVETQNQKSAYLETELKRMKDHNSELERHLDDIMYTISTQGNFNTFVHSDGKTIDLRTTQGTPVDLEGWKMAASKRTERHLQSINHKNSQITELQSEVSQLRETITLGQDTISKLQRDLKEETAIVTKLHQDIVCLSTKIENLTDENIVLTDLLKAADREKAEEQEYHRTKLEEMALKHEEEVEKLNDKITRLRLNLEIAQNKKACDQCVQAQSITRSVDTQSSQVKQATVNPLPKPAKRPRNKLSFDEIQAENRSPVTDLITEQPPSHKKTTKKSGVSFLSPKEEGASKGGMRLKAPTPALADPTWAEQVDELELSTEVDSSSSVTTSSTLVEEETSSPAAPSPPWCKAKTKKGKKPRKFVFQSVNNNWFGTNTEPPQYTPKVFSQNAGAKRPGRAVQIVDNTCSRCGLTFPPKTSPQTLQKHIEMHAKFST